VNSTHQKVNDSKIKLFVNIPGLSRVDLEHHRALSKAITPVMQGLACEYVNAGVLIVNRR
jgi:hypothetical protein